MALGTNAQRKNKLLLCLMWFLEGSVVGFGAILPGISGGTLCVAFGMYRPIIETLSSLKTGIKKHGLMLCVFLLGVAVGFIGLSRIAAAFLEKGGAWATCAFIGFILGTVPDLWKDAGREGRSKISFAALAVCFTFMLGLLALMKTTITVTVEPSIAGYLFCGLLWGLSFIIPGLSSSSLLLFFGLYQPMLEGISGLRVTVLLPMGIGMIMCLILLSKLIGQAYKKRFSLISHGVLGIVMATVVMILPYRIGTIGAALVNLLFILGGAAISFVLSHLCNKLNKH